MKLSMNKLSLKIRQAPITASSISYRPPSWPPPDDWVVSEDSEGEPLSRWESSTWDFSAWAGTTFVLDFSSGHLLQDSDSLSKENQHEAKLCVGILMWGPKGIKSWASLRKCFYVIKRFIHLCDASNVLLSEVHRFPKVLARVPEAFSGLSGKRLPTLLNRIASSKELVGFAPIDEFTVAEVARLLGKYEHEVVQRAYIPLRIWKYQVQRLRECIDDFLANKEKVVACYQFCIDAYVNNFGSMEAAFLQRTERSHANGTDRRKAVLPFGKKAQVKREPTTRIFYGPFEATAERFEIDNLLKKWVHTSKAGLGINSISSYMSLIQFACCAYIMNFTLQRKEEAASLRADCLIWEIDPTLGRIPIIRGETTKTDPDSDARWPTSPNVEVAVEAATIIAKLRVSCASQVLAIGCTADDLANPYLFHASYEPWSTMNSAKKKRNYSIRSQMQTYNWVLKRYPRLFDEATIKITAEDLNLAYLFTPNLKKMPAFKVGEKWPLSYHQLRRTGAINMFDSGIVSDSTMQVLLKHRHIFQSRYYGQNFSRLRFNSYQNEAIESSKILVLAKQIEELVSDRYVSPYGKKHKEAIIVRFMSQKTLDALKSASSVNGGATVRENFLGVCTSQEHCEYGGIESWSACSGGDGKQPCADGLYDSGKRPQVQEMVVDLQKRISQTQQDSPRRQALLKEEHGLRNFLNATKN